MRPLVLLFIRSLVECTRDYSLLEWHGCGKKREGMGSIGSM